jgi:hypothetical protein
MHGLLLCGASIARLGFRPPLRASGAQHCPERRQRRTVFFKPLICLLLALQGLAYAAPDEPSDASDPKVMHWLASAESALAAGRLIAPPEDNALGYLERVFAADPANSRAARMLDQLVLRFTTRDHTEYASQELARMKILEVVSSLARGDEGLGRAREPDILNEALRSSTVGKDRDGQNFRPAQDRVQLIRKYLRPQLAELKDCHVSLGLASLQLGDPAEAGRQRNAAADLVAQYQLQEEGRLGYLSQLLAQAKTPRTSYQWKNDVGRQRQPTERHADLARKYLRPQLKELKDCHIWLGLAALQLGDPAEAGRQQEAAADLVARYQLAAGGLNYLSQLLEELEAPKTSYGDESSGEAPRLSRGENPQVLYGEPPPASAPRPPYRAFGTF